MKHYTRSDCREKIDHSAFIWVMICVCRQHDFVLCESQPGIAGSWLTFSENDFVMQLGLWMYLLDRYHFGSVGFFGVSWVVFSLVLKQCISKGRWAATTVTLENLVTELYLHIRLFTLFLDSWYVFVWLWMSQLDMPCYNHKLIEF